jgi:ankyrin repeat protein
MKSIVLTISIIFLSTVFTDSNRLSGQSAENSLIEAVANMDFLNINVLLAEGAVVDSSDQDGNTPLMVAAKIGNPRIVTLLLAHNPEINRKNNEGNTALMIAAEHGQLFVAEQLIAKGANQYSKNAMGLNPLQIAKRNGHAAVVDLLSGKEERPVSK